MIPEHRVARAAHRILWPQSSWEQYERTLVSQRRQGYFLSGSTTRQWLLADLQVAGAKAETRWFWAPFEVCQVRIVAQFERGEITAPEYRRRIELLKRCWRPRPSARR